MKKIVSLFLLCACCFSLFSCSLLIEDEKTEWQTSFILGAIDANGNSVSSKSSLRTSEAIPCDGITLVPDLWFSMEYRFFFYDENGGFVGYTPAMSGTSDAKIPSGAVYAHIVMTPFDENGRPFYSIDPLYVVDYAEKVTVKIDRKQRYNPNLCEIAKKSKYTGRASVGLLTSQQIMEYMYYENADFDLSDGAGSKIKLKAEPKYDIFIIPCANVKSFYFYTNISWDAATYTFYNDSFVGTTCEHKVASRTNGNFITVPEGSTYAVFCKLDKNAVLDLCVYEYR